MRSSRSSRRSVRIAVVAFGGTALVTQRPTEDRAAVLAADGAAEAVGGHVARRRHPQRR